MSNTGRYGIRHNGAFELRWLNWILTLGNATGIHATANGTDESPNGHAAAVRAASVPEAVSAIEQIGLHILDYAAMKYYNAKGENDRPHGMSIWTPRRFVCWDCIFVR